MIVDVEATPAHRTAEVESTKTMIDRVEERFDLKPERLIGDTAYGTVAMLAWMVDEQDIAPHLPVWDRTAREDDTLSRREFEWNEQTNEYRCPQGHALRSQWRPSFKIDRTHITKADTIIYRASQHDWSARAAVPRSSLTPETVAQDGRIPACCSSCCQTGFSRR